MPISNPALELLMFPLSFYSVANHFGVFLFERAGSPGSAPTLTIHPAFLLLLARL